MFAEEPGRGIEGREERKKERKVSDNGTVCYIYQIYYNPVLLTMNTELNSRDSFNWNLILKVVEYQRAHTHTHTHTHTHRHTDTHRHLYSHEQSYETALFDVACNLKHSEGKLYRLTAEAQDKEGRELFGQMEF